MSMPVSVQKTEEKFQIMPGNDLNVRLPGDQSFRSEGLLVDTDSEKLAK